MPIVKRSKSAEDFKRIIEAYKVQNPVKFAMKEKALMAKLEKLEGKTKEEPKEVKPKKK